MTDRTDDDTWDVTTGVGTTALSMAYARAYETAQDKPLFVDPYAQIFLDDGVQAGWAPPPGATPAAPSGTAEPAQAARMLALMNYAACRTKFFDDFFLRACAAGIGQAVILGAGLDSRPWRLSWGCDVVVYEIDQPAVLDFKVTALWNRNLAPACEHRPIPIDLRHDWVKALRAMGFDDSQPCAWSVEGLLSYLRAEARDELFARIHAISAPQSRLAVEASAAAPLTASAERRRAVMHETRARAAAAGNTTLRDVRAMWFPDGDTDLVAWLTGHGWCATTTEANDLMDRYGRRPEGDAAYATPRSAFVDAVRL
jgi:methyltransferase (TIGR00027 family)